MSAKPKKDDREDYGGMNPTTLSKQYTKYRDYADELAAQVRALGGRPKLPDDPFDSLDLLERIALTLAEADRICHPAHSIPLDKGGHHIPHLYDRGLPGASVRAARYRRDRLVKTFESGLRAWQESKHNDFQPIKRTTGPLSRCRNEGNCDMANRWVELWDEKGSHEFCSGCGHRLPPPPKEPD